MLTLVNGLQLGTEHLLNGLILLVPVTRTVKLSSQECGECYRRTSGMWNWKKAN